MTKPPEDFEFDVALSFLAGDEPLALRLSDLIRERLRTFIYSKAQEQLAGRDGEEQFSEVFGKRARLVVILHRQKWGSTPWTRIEMTAIKNRAFDQGYDFTLWVSLDTPANLPDFVPKTRLYADIGTYGEKAVAGVIVAMATERGAVATQETLEQKTLRAARLAEAEQRRATFHGPGDGVQRARDRAMAMMEKIRQWASRPDQPFALEVHKTAINGVLVVAKDDVRRRAISVAVGWRQGITNSTDQSAFEYQLFNGVPNIVPGAYSFGDATQLGTHKYYCDLASSGEIVWAATRRGSDQLNESQLVEKVLADFMAQIVKT